MPRLPYPDLNAPHLAAAVAELSKARGGQLLNVDKTMLHRPEFARASRELFRVVRTSFELSERLRELVICRVAILTRAKYEYNQHEKLALRAGLTQDELNALRQPGVPVGLDEADTLAIRLTDAMTLDVQVPQGLFDQVRARFSEKLVVELIATIASYNYMSRFLEALDIEVE